MGNNISHLIISGNNDEDDSGNKNPIGALEILDHFSEEEKERWIVIVIAWHREVWIDTSNLLASALAHKNVAVVYANEVGSVIGPNRMLPQKPEPSMENLLQQIADDLEKQIAGIRDDVDSYKLSHNAEVSHKKEQEKRRRRHLNNKKISSKKKW